MGDPNNKKLSKEEQEVLTDKMAEKVVDMLGKTKPIQKIRHSHFLTAIFGAASLALFWSGSRKYLQIYRGGSPLPWDSSSFQ